MRKIVSYGIATAQGDVNKLAKDVNEKIAEGYEPFGSLAVTTCEDEIYFSQAMVIYES